MPVPYCSPALRAVFRRRSARTRPVHATFRGGNPPAPPTPPPTPVGGPSIPFRGGRGAGLRPAPPRLTGPPSFIFAPPIGRRQPPPKGAGRRPRSVPERPRSLPCGRSRGLKAPAEYSRGPPVPGVPGCGPTTGGRRPGRLPRPGLPRPGAPRGAGLPGPPVRVRSGPPTATGLALRPSMSRWSRSHHTSAPPGLPAGRWGRRGRVRPPGWPRPAWIYRIMPIPKMGGQSTVPQDSFKPRLTPPAHHPYTARAMTVLSPRCASWDRTARDPGPARPANRTGA